MSVTPEIETTEGYLSGRNAAIMRQIGYESFPMGKVWSQELDNLSVDFIAMPLGFRARVKAAQDVWSGPEKTDLVWQPGDDAVLSQPPSIEDTSSVLIGVRRGFVTPSAENIIQYALFADKRIFSASKLVQNLIFGGEVEKMKWLTTYCFGIVGLAKEQNRLTGNQVRNLMYETCLQTARNNLNPLERDRTKLERMNDTLALARDIRG